MNNFEIVRVSPKTLQAYGSLKLQEQLIDLQIEIMTLRDLVKKLDPAHMYVFNLEYQAFVKTKDPDYVEPEEDKGIYEGAIITEDIPPQGGAE